MCNCNKAKKAQKQPKPVTTSASTQLPQQAVTVQSSSAQTSFRKTEPIAYNKVVAGRWRRLIK